MALFIPNASAEGSAAHFPKLIIRGLEYENACTAKKKLDLRRAIEKQISPDFRKLQSAVEFVLCANLSQRNAKRMSTLLDAMVTTSYEGTGEDASVEKISKNRIDAKDIMAEGSAWNANILFQNGEVKVRYYSSEACIESLKFQHSEGKWLIHEFGGACD